MTPGAGRWLLAALLAAAGVVLTTTGVRQEHRAPPAPPAAPVAVAEPTGAPAPRLRPLGRSEPTRLRIPAIGVDTGLMRLGLRPDHTVEVPPLTAGAPAGWYERSVTPGEPGPAVILGHVDSARHGPAVFHRLGALRPGDRVHVGRADGGTVGFVVTAVLRYPKRAFPTARVYGPSSDAGLRLITCGGAFDRVRRSYRDSVVVYATRG